MTTANMIIMMTKIIIIIITLNESDLISDFLNSRKGRRNDLFMYFLYLVVVVEFLNFIL